MSATLHVLAGALLAVALAGPVGGQVARIDVPGHGGVTGLEMGIEGSLHARPGGRLSWFVTVHEIVAGRDLRPAPRAALRVLASFQPNKPLLEAVSDAGGRAALSFDVPADLERSFQLVIEVRSPRRVQRRFEVTVQLGRRYRTELHVDRRTIEPGGTLQAWGRVMDLARGRPSSEHALTIQVRGGAPQKARTDRRGVFHVAVQAPDLPQTAFSVEASATDADPVKVEGKVAAVAPPPALVIVARPERDVVAPGALVQVDVTVRTAQGRPVPGATLTGLSIPQAKKDKPKVVKPTLTDGQGRARVPWRVVSTAPLSDVTGQLQAVREGLGTGSATVRVRSTRRTQLLAWAVEGGALVPGLPGRLFLRGFHPDGRPLAGAAVRVDAGQPTAGPTITTDAEGVAVVDVTVGKPKPSQDCSGPTTSAAMVHLGSGTEELCLPVDPEATVRVRPRSPATTAGQPVEIELEWRPTVAAAPVAVTVLAHDPGGASWRPVAQAVAPPRARRIVLRPSPDEVGLLWVRARPLVGPARQEVRGGGALVWSSPGPGLALSVAPSPGTSGAPFTSGGAQALRVPTPRMVLDLQGSGADPASGFAMALPVDEGERLLGELRSTHGQRPEPGGGPARLAGFLAANTPVDDAAAGILHEGKVLPVAMPAQPAELGLLRDPWRSRARFVRGRLGRLLRAVEDHVAAHIPDRLRQVAIRGPRGWRFNREMLRGITDKLGAESMGGLDGSPLTIDALQRLAPAFVYDNVARRLTRQRLLDLLVLLRAFVREHRLDHAWPRRGDPTTWLIGLVDWQPADTGQSVERAQLFDAWGRPFVLRRAPGGRARFRSIEPVVGYELISMGPDGRAGTDDDVYDPFGRVLRGGVYAEAVGEETLLARLRGVEFGRATIEALAKVFEVEESADQEAPVARSTRPWNAPSRAPSPTVDDLALHQARGAWPTASVFQALGSQGVGVTLALSPEPHRYLVVAGAYGRQGVAVFAASPLEGGAPLLLDAPLPQRLRQGEQLVVPVRLTNLRDGQRISLQASGEGPIEASVVGPAGPDAVAGRTRIVRLRLAPASRAGTARGTLTGRIHLRVRDANGTILRQVERSVQVMADGTLRAQHTGAMVRGQATLSVQLPPDAQQPRTVLVVSGPRDLLGDPGLGEVRRAHPALFGWAHALRGRPAPASLLDALTAQSSLEITALENACAAVTWSAAKVDQPQLELGRALLRVRSALPASLSERSALLVALAAGAPGLTAPGKGAVDPVAALVSHLREEAWNAVEKVRGEPAVMAQLAAGLLLLDRRDAAGRQFFNAARGALVSGRHGGQVLGGAAGKGREAWIGTVALAIAARQIGEHALAVKLAAGTAPRLYLGLEGVEAAFWMLAASVHGAFGSASPTAVKVETADAPPRAESGSQSGVRSGARPWARDLPLRDGVGSVDLARGVSRVVVRSRDGRPVLARLEARYLRPVVSATAAPLSARIDGYVGHVGETAALEITVESKAEMVTHPVLEVLLPSAAALDPQALRSMAHAAAVRRIDPPDLQGLLRIHLGSMDPGQRRRLPLPVRWIGGGTVCGLSLAVYDAERPWLISSVPARTLRLAPPPQEVW